MPIAAAHFTITVVLAVAASISAYGAGMGDTYHGDDGTSFFNFLLALWQLPLAIIQKITISFHEDGSGLPPGAWFPLAALSSLAFGYVLACFFPKTREEKAK